jgi:hypothetical protein
MDKYELQGIYQIFDQEYRVIDDSENRELSIQRPSKSTNVSILAIFPQQNRGILASVGKKSYRHDESSANGRLKPRLPSDS